MRTVGGNWCFISIVTMLCIITQLAASGGDFFIARWVDIEEKYVSVSLYIQVIKIIIELHRVVIAFPKDSRSLQ